ncbi:MAG: 16S rRNA (uracil(1498)-N(3))-methyltransferase [Spirochaetales bacterium]|nr:16S rRNA (uracil(1498)-N(3))-methyltransferase [Spirochaetales bacterium]
MELTGEEFHYLTRVLRKRPGDRFEGTDRHGNPVSILLERCEPERCILEISPGAGSGGAVSGATPGDKTEQAVNITLFQCIPKANKMDMIVRQMVETGVGTIVPVLSENSVPRFDGNTVEKKRERWQRIARQAMQQSGRTKPPVIMAPVVISELPGIWHQGSSPQDVCLLFYENPISKNGLHHLLSSNPLSVGICVGPEGGFAPHEVATLLNSGLQPVYINTNVLRTETAALYAVAAVQTVILEKDYWKVRQ